MLRRLLIFLAACAVLFSIASLALLNGGLLPRLTNLDPGVFTIDFGAARWRPPFGVAVEKLELKIQSDGYRIRVLADEAAGTFRPAPMRKLRVAFTDITARGVAVHVQLPEPASGTPRERLPPMADFAPATPTPEPLVSAELTDLRDVQVREVWVDGFRYVGDVGVSGGFALEPKQTLTIHPAHVTLDGGVVALPNGLEARLQPSTVSGRVDAMPLDIPAQQRMLRAVDADVKLGLHAPNLNFFNSLLFAEVPEVRLLYGAGEVTLNVRVERGVVGEGSEVIVAPRKLGVRVPHFDIVGRASIAVKALSHHAVATLSLPDFELDLRENDTLVASGAGFTLRAKAAPLDLTELRDVEVSLTLEQARAADLRFLDRFIPERSGVTLVGGTGHLSAEAALSTKTRKASGLLSLKASRLELRNRGAHVAGAAEVSAVLNSFDLRRNTFDLGGTNVKLTGVTVKAHQVAYRGVDLSAVAPRALFAPDGDHPVQASLAVGVSNLQPLMAIISANVELPGIVVGLLDIPDVAAAAELDVKRNTVTLAPMTLTARGLHVDARMVLTETAKKELEPHGAAFAKLGPFTVGLGFDGGTVTPVIFGAPEWYARQLDAGAPP